jgi:hypothetical protein
MEELRDQVIMSEWQMALTVIGFILTWGGVLAAYAQERGKMIERIDNLKRDTEEKFAAVQNELRLSNESVTNQFRELRTSLLDSDGDIKYLTVKRHTDICSAHTESMDKDMGHLKEAVDVISKNVDDLKDIKINIDKIQDAIMLLATNPNMRDAGE